SAFNLPFGANLQLQPLAANGGLGQTHLLGSGSAAIDHGANPAGLATDQRGGSFTRVNFLPDIGSVEGASPNLPVAALGQAADVTANGGTAYTFTVAYADAAAVRAST